MLINSDPPLTAHGQAVEKKTVKNCLFLGKIVKVHGNLIFSSHGQLIKARVFSPSPCILDADYDFHFSDYGSLRDIEHSAVNISSESQSTCRHKLVNTGPGIVQFLRDFTVNLLLSSDPSLA